MGNVVDKAKTHRAFRLQAKNAGDRNPMELHRFTPCNIVLVDVWLLAPSVVLWRIGPTRREEKP